MATTPDSHHDGKYGAKKLQLRITADAIAHHRRAIWEQTRQFMWWLLFIVVVLVLVGTTVGFNFWIRVATILAGSVGGILIALTGLRVIGYERAALEERIQAYDRLADDLGLGESVVTSAGKSGHEGFLALLGGLLGIKAAKMDSSDLFQLSFMLAMVLYALAFIATLVYALVR